MIKRLLLLVILILVSMSMSLVAQEWSETLERDGMYYYPEFAMGPDGAWYIAGGESDILEKLSVYKDDGSGPVALGGRGISTSALYGKMGIAVATDNSVYVGYPMTHDSFKLTVQKWNGSNWSSVGPTASSTGRIQSTAVAVNSQGNPVVAYTEMSETTDGIVAMQTWNPNTASWDVQHNLSPGNARGLDVLTVGDSIYLAYSDLTVTDPGYAIVVKRFVGGVLQSTTTITSANGGTRPRLAASPTGTVYVMWKEGSWPLVAKVARVTDGAFTMLDTVASDLADNVNAVDSAYDICVAPNGIPYIAYFDELAPKSVVREWNGTSWSTIEAPTQRRNYYHLLAASSNGTLYMLVGSNASYIASRQISLFATYNVGSHGTLSGEGHQTIAYSQDGAAVTAIPDAEYIFDRWSDGVLTAIRRDTNVILDLNVTANFVASSSITAPTFVSANVAGTTTVNLTWENSTAPVFSSVTIVRKSDGFPTSVTDGVLVTSGNTGDSYSDTPGTRIAYYGIYSLSAGGVYSDAATVFVVVDGTPPDAPTLTASKPVLNGTTINLTWDVPITTSTFALYRTIGSGDPELVSGSMSSVTTTNVQTGLADGAYVYSIYAVDEYGNTSNVGSSEPIVIDTHRPVSPQIMAVKPSANSVTLSWDPVADVDYYVLFGAFGDGDFVTIDSRVPSPVTYYDWIGIGDGRYRYRLVAVDSVGNFSDLSNIAELTIDTVPPFAPELSAIKPVSNGTTVNLSWNVPDGASTFTLYRTYESGSPELLGGVMPSTTTSNQQTALGDGSYVFSIYATDSFGNTSNVGLSITVNIDTSTPNAPEITASKASPNSSAINLSWNVPDNTSTFALYRVMGNGEPVLIDSAIPSSTTTNQQSDLSDGVYIYTIYAVDSCGNTSNVGQSTTILIDTISPDTPSLNASKVLQNGTTVQLSWTVPTTTSYLALYRTIGTGDPQLIDGSIPSSVTNNEQTNLADGNYVYSIYAVDEYGNTSNAGVSIPCLIDTQTPGTPNLTLTQPSMNWIALTWDPIEGVDYYVLFGSYSDSELVTIDSRVNPLATRYEWIGIGDGRYRYQLLAVDSVGNRSGRSNLVETVVDTTPPVQPVLVAAKPVLNGRTINLEWDVPDTTSIFSLYRSLDSGEPELVHGAISNTTTGNRQVDLPDGTYVYSLYAADQYGNTSNAGLSEAVIIDSTPPEKLSEFLIVSENETVTINWAVSDGTGIVTLLVSRLDFPTSTENGEVVTQNSAVTSWVGDLVEDGIYYYSVFETDFYGNRGEVATCSIVIETLPSIQRLSEGNGIRKGALVITEQFDSAQPSTIGSDSQTATLDVQSRLRVRGTTIGSGYGARGYVLIGTSNAVWESNNDVSLGVDGGVGYVIQTEGAVSINGILRVGSNASTGSYTLSGGVLAVDRLMIGAIGGSGEFIWTGGLLRSGSVVGNLSNNGGILEVLSDAPLMITGNYTQDGASRMLFVLKSTNASLVTGNRSIGDVMPLLRCSGALSISGTIVIQNNGYAPKVGDKIVLVRWPSEISAAQRKRILSSITFSLPELDSRLSWNTSSFDTDGTISIVSASSDLMPSRPLNFPNPFKMTTGTSIGYWLNSNADIELRIYNANGYQLFSKQLLSGIDDGAKSGYNRVVINRDTLGMDLPSGVYPYILINGTGVVGKGRLVVRPY